MFSRRFLSVSLLVALALTSCSKHPASSQAPGSSDAAAILRGAVTTMTKATSYRAISVVSTRTAKSTLTVKVDSRFELPDRVRSIATIGKTTVQSITVKGNTWVRNPKTGHWTSKITSRASSRIDDPFAFLRSVTGATRGGEQVIRGSRAVEITGNVPAKLLLRGFSSTGAAAGTVAVHMWVDSASSRVVRITEGTPSSAITLTADLLAFGTHFGITAPK